MGHITRFQVGRDSQIVGYNFICSLKKDPQKASYIACMVSKWILIKWFFIILAIADKLPDSVLNPSLGVEMEALTHFVNALKAYNSLAREWWNGPIIYFWSFKCTAQKRKKSRLSIHQTSGFMIRLTEVKNTIFNSFFLMKCFQILRSKTCLRSSVLRGWGITVNKTSLCNIVKELPL